MITNREIANAANEWQLRHDVVEKDYVLGWLLAGVASHRDTRRWAFKGGTCLRKCWFETYRFSEDLDYTVEAGDLDPVVLTERFTEIGTWLYERCGLEIRVDERSFRPRRNKRGNPRSRVGSVTWGPWAHPRLRRSSSTSLRTKSSFVRSSAGRCFHPFTDADAIAGGSDHVAVVLSYSLPELMGEKLRALAERCRPRDLYDVIHTHRHPDLIGRAHDVVGVLERKCAHVGIEPPTLDSIRATTFRAEIEGEWSSMLGHQLPYLPPFEEFWAELDELFAWLGGGVAVPALQPMPVGSDVTEWRPARYMTTWNTGAPLELIRFAGANRLKIAVDHRPERGRVGTRVVEPYSLRRSREGHLLLYVLNDRRQIRSYRVDRIRGASIQRETFAPRFRIEF